MVCRFWFAGGKSPRGVPRRKAAAPNPRLALALLRTWLLLLLLCRTIVDIGVDVDVVRIVVAV